jgi:hypothetical protein
MKNYENFWVNFFLKYSSMSYIIMTIVLILLIPLVFVLDVNRIYVSIIFILYFVVMILCGFSFDMFLYRIKGTYPLQCKILKIIPNFLYSKKNYNNILFKLIGLKTYRLHGKTAFENEWIYETFTVLSYDKLKVDDELKLMKLNDTIYFGKIVL